MEQKNAVQARSTILFADDNPTSTTITVAVLAYCGYDIITAANGAHALELFNKNKHSIDLFISDINMPIMNGRAAYDEIRKVRPNMPVIFINNGPSEIVTPSYLATISGILLIKPYSIKRLQAHIRSMLTHQNNSHLKAFPPKISTLNSQPNSFQKALAIK